MLPCEGYAPFEYAWRCIFPLGDDECRGNIQEATLSIWVALQYRLDSPVDLRPARSPNRGMLHKPFETGAEGSMGDMPIASDVKQREC